MAVLHAAFLRIESVEGFAKRGIRLQQYIAQVRRRFAVTRVAGRNSNRRLAEGRGHGAHVETIIVAEVRESAVVEALLLLTVLIVRGRLKKFTRPQQTD